jgi:hypothetical protein
MTAMVRITNRPITLHQVTDTTDMGTTLPASMDTGDTMGQGTTTVTVGEELTEIDGKESR